MLLRHSVMLGLAVGLLLGPSARAEDPAPGADGGLPAGWARWTVDGLMQQACDGIARRYNLTDEQAAYTRGLMAARVKKFLDQHYDEVEGLLREAFAVRLSGRTPDLEQLKSWAERAQPLVKAAQKEIVDANMSWREVLSPEQQKMHDL